MIAIVNATPLIALAVVNRLDLLSQIFGEVIVPTAVYQEVVSTEMDRPGAQIIAQAKWLKVMSPQAVPTLEPILLGLDAGEIDVLLLAREQQPDWVIIDERQARRVARALGLPIKGTVGVLLTAALIGLLSKEEALNDLTELLKCGIRISSRLQKWLREELERLQ